MRTLNTRILIIDDEEAVRESFRDVLAPRARNDVAGAAARLLLGETEAPPATELAFEVDLAESGRRGLERVREAQREGRPYAAIFCDMRMPGWDGLETVQRIRELDEKAEVVFVTAYSDHSIDTIAARVGENVGYFVKPFANEEVRQLASKLVHDWNKARELEALIKIVTAIHGSREDMDRLLHHLLEQVCVWLETDSAAIFTYDEDAQAPRFHLGVGALQDGDAATRALATVEGSVLQTGEITFQENLRVFPLSRHGVAMAFSGRRPVTPDRVALLSVFLQHVGLAVEHSKMRERMVLSMRLASVGQAVGFLLHDVRGPIGLAQMYARLLSRDELADREHVQKIEHYTQRAIDMLSDTLALCRGQMSIDARPMDVKAALAEASLWREELRRRKVTLEEQVPEGLRATLDPAKLERALWNLVKNAAEACASEPSPTVRVRAEAAGEHVRIVVEDNGPGPSEALSDSIFEVMVTDKESGSGFGLAIVQQIVDAHGGEVRFERDDGWSRFVVSLPAG